MSKIAEYRIQHWQFVHESATVYYDKTSQIKIYTIQSLQNSTIQKSPVSFNISAEGSEESLPADDIVMIRFP